MTRFLLPLLAAIALTAATAPRPWTAVATPVANGSYLIGNPKARVKLVEYVSYTCPHCAHFTHESDAALGAMVRSGSTSIELRNQVIEHAIGMNWNRPGERTSKPFKVALG